MRRLCFSLLALGLVFLLDAGGAFALYASPNYSSNEVNFGSGGDNNQSSPSYSANASLGSLGVGNTSSPHYQAYSGFLTPNEPFLELGVDTSVVDLGTLDTGATKTGAANFHVRAYLDSGYTVQTLSQPPTSNTATPHALTAMSTRAGPTTGTEQFGINLVANTSPATFGANPAPQPSSGFASGIAAPGYDTANQFKYVVGDTIAQSDASGWGATIYTISYIADISIATPAGSYSMIHNLVVVATY